MELAQGLTNGFSQEKKEVAVYNETRSAWTCTNSQCTYSLTYNGLTLS